MWFVHKGRYPTTYPLAWTDETEVTKHRPVFPKPIDKPYTRESYRKMRDNLVVSLSRLKRWAGTSHDMDCIIMDSETMIEMLGDEYIVGQWMKDDLADSRREIEKGLPSNKSISRTISASKT